MPIYKQDNGTWYVMARYTDWTGKKQAKVPARFYNKERCTGVGKAVPITKTR